MSEYIITNKQLDRFGIPAELFTEQEIVRCRDCYFADEIEGGYWCDRFENGKEHTTPNGFCAWAERRGA